jgi:hypothetical protein
MSYVKQNFENYKTRLTAEMLELMEDGIIDADIYSQIANNTSIKDGTYNVVFLKKNGKVVPVLSPVANMEQEEYYGYDVENSGVLSLGDMYKKTFLYSCAGGQDGIIYKDLCFRGTGRKSVTISNPNTGEVIGSMNWDKADIIYPHDNSMTTNIKASMKPFQISWVLNTTCSSQTGEILESATRATSEKIYLAEHKEAEFTVNSHDYIVACYDDSNTYLGQFITSKDAIVKSNPQWFSANAKVTASDILAVNKRVSYLVLVVEESCEPEYEFSEYNEDCYIYSSIYNTYIGQQNPHIGECCVYHLLETNDGWTNSLKQLLKIDFINNIDMWPPSSDPRPFGNFVVDLDNQFLYVFTMYTSKNKSYWYKFNLPDITDGVWNETYGCFVCILTADDIIDSWTTDYQYYIQGACVHGGLIWATEGYTLPSENLPRLRVVDPAKKKEIATFNFYADGDPMEPELIDFYNGVCYFSSGYSMYILTIV